MAKTPTAPDMELPNLRATPWETFDLVPPGSDGPHERTWRTLGETWVRRTVQMLVPIAAEVLRATGGRLDLRMLTTKYPAYMQEHIYPLMPGKWEPDIKFRHDFRNHYLRTAAIWQAMQWLKENDLLPFLKQTTVEALRKAGEAAAGDDATVRERLAYIQAASELVEQMEQVVAGDDHLISEAKYTELLQGADYEDDTDREGDDDEEGDGGQNNAT